MVMSSGKLSTCGCTAIKIGLQCQRAHQQTKPQELRAVRFALVDKISVHPSEAWGEEMWPVGPRVPRDAALVKSKRQPLRNPFAPWKSGQTLTA